MANIENYGGKGRAIMWIIIFFLLFVGLIIYIYRLNFVLSWS